MVDNRTDILFIYYLFYGLIKWSSNFRIDIASNFVIICIPKTTTQL